MQGTGGRGSWCLALALALTGCRQTPSDWPVSHDLIDGFALAEVWTDTRSIDFGSLKGRRHLVSGWHVDEWDRRRRTGFVRGQGAESRLRFHLMQPRRLMVKLQGRSEPALPGVPVICEVLVNGNRVRSVELDERLRHHRLSVPEGLLRQGENELTLRYRSSDPEQGVDGVDAEPGSWVRWYRAEFVDRSAEDPPVPTVIEGDRALWIPHGTRVEYYLELFPTAALTLEELRFRGASGGRLEIALEEDGRAPVHVASLKQTDAELEIPLLGSGRRVVRLTLRATLDRRLGAADSGVLLKHPAVRSPEDSTGKQPESRAKQAAKKGSPRRQTNVLLYVVDTLRADHLGIYGYPKPVSPELDSFAAGATIFENAIAQSSWTRASMASVFTGLWPVKHGANRRRDVLAPEAVTLAELLQEAGYLTVARIRNWNVFPVFGFRQGFDDFEALGKGSAERLNRHVERWLGERPTDRPFFLWVHTVEPHSPYRPPPEFATRFAESGQAVLDLDRQPGFKRTREMTAAEQQTVIRHLLSLYDGEIASNDRQFGKLLRLLERHGLRDDTLVIFVSDHGEEFLEHGTWEHGKNLFAENLDIPLVIRFPDRGHGQRIPEVVQHIDLLPTILDFLELPIPEHIEGRSLLPLVSGDRPAEFSTPQRAFSYLDLDGLPHRSLVQGDWKLIERLTDKGELVWVGLFDRRRDPGESTNLAIDHPIRVRYMGLLLEAKSREGSLLHSEEAILDQRTERALRALGYLQ